MEHKKIETASPQENPTPAQVAPYLVEALALPNDTAADALDRVNHASVGSLRATSSPAYLKGLEKHVAAWLVRIQDRLAEVSK